MLVYGDSVRRTTAAAAAADIAQATLQAWREPAGLDRHAALVGALIEAGALAQGLADRSFHAAGGHDADEGGDCDATSAAMALATALAERCAMSWDSRFAECGEAPQLELTACLATAPELPIRMRQPEGYAFYAVYPEAYLAAARRVARLSTAWRSIGLRSIGTSLSAMVAVGLDAPGPRTLRPVGHPFARELAARPPAPPLPPGCRFAIVDEGPGLSGSSMAAAARWLMDAGVPADSVHLFPAHGHGPGTQSSDPVRELWQRLPVHQVGFDSLILQAPEPAHRLAEWVAALVGPLKAPLREVSGGGWRDGEDWGAAGWPPAHPWAEARKFLAETSSGRWLVKFAGLGRIGFGKLDRARALAEAGFCPGPAGLCHGFLVERWRDDAVPLPARLQAMPRAVLVAGIGAYLAFRARAFPAQRSSGASLPELHRMGRANSIEALGPDTAPRWDAWLDALDALDRETRPIEVDGRLHAWEWRVAGDRLIKTDALDHHAAHDLIGCQDVLWDVAGAEVEFDLDAAQSQALRLELVQRGVRLGSAALATLLRACYLAFQLGSYTMAAAAADRTAASATNAEALDAAVARYRAGLERLLGSREFDAPVAAG
ncbi:MAG: hypothetical protein EOO24_03335 [Comamonadaceae bacterium]|nr:MAG: hypothetical protein EOO24_03335 [Comamonadaceae bacterium]